MKPFAFEDLPNILGTLMMRMESIERMVREIRDNKPPEDFDPGLMTILEASKLVNLSVATIYSKVCRKEMPASKKGKKLYFIRSELLDWIKSGRIKTMPEMQREADKRFNK